MRPCSGCERKDQHHGSIFVLPEKRRGIRHDILLYDPLRRGTRRRNCNRDFSRFEGRRCGTPIQGTIRLSNTQDREVVLVESAKISIQQAVKAAVSRDNGAVQRVELENEDGFLVYNVELVSADKKLHEVKVDAGNGNILRVDLDTADQEKNEDHENGEQND